MVSGTLFQDRKNSRTFQDKWPPAIINCAMIILKFDAYQAMLLQLGLYSISLARGKVSVPMPTVLGL